MRHKENKNEIDWLKKMKGDSLLQAIVRDRERMRRGEQPVSADALSRIRWWIRIAEGEVRLPNQFARFIALWEAFNGWLRSRRPVKYGQGRTTDSSLVRGIAEEEKVLQHFEELRDSSTSYKHTLQSLEQMSPVYEVWSQQTTEQKWSIHPPYKLSEVLNLVYKIRCNLFHGGKEYTERDLRLVVLAFNALYPLFMRIPQ